jgi:hypothetical protein
MYPTTPATPTQITEKITEKISALIHHRILRPPHFSDGIALASAMRSRASRDEVPPCIVVHQHTGGNDQALTAVAPQHDQTGLFRDIAEGVP